MITNLKIYKWDELEAIYVLGILSMLAGNKSATARLLGYNLRTFKSRINRWEVQGFKIPKYDPIIDRKLRSWYSNIPLIANQIKRKPL